MTTAAEAPPVRRSYLFVLEIVTMAPLTHGAGNDGNIQRAATEEINVPVFAARRADDPLEPGGKVQIGWREVRVPRVSGSAMKATLREFAVQDYLERAGVRDGELSKDALRLLLKGGKTTAGGASVSLEEMRRYIDLCPALAVFGAMDGGRPQPARVIVSPVRPYTEALVEGGIAPRSVSAVRVGVDGTAMTTTDDVPLFEGVVPLPDHMVLSEVTYYRHDLGQSTLTRLLPIAEQSQMLELRTARAAMTAPNKEERREANESMPHSMECWRTGVPGWCEIRLADATDVEAATLMIAMTRWIASGGHLGGGKTKGHGACRVRIAGAISHTPTSAATAEGALVPTEEMGETGRLFKAYTTHLAARADRIRGFLREGS